MVIAWLDESPGYVPVEIAEKLGRHPRRFALFGDGTVEYRDEDFTYFRVTLSANERRKLVESLVNSDFLEDTPLAKEKGPRIMDAGSESFGMKVGGKERSVEVVALAFLAKQYPDDRGLQACHKICTVMRNYRHPDAKRIER